jgi:CheY-like chemotaxis protein
MHRVVRLTFADDQRMEISVARDRNEADQNLSSRKTDLIIAYLRFDGLTDPRYFESLRLVTPRILLLAESEENIEPYARVGLNNVLRKPFHSDELRQTVEDMLAQNGSSTEIAPAPSATASAPMVPPAPPPGFSAPVAPPAPPPGFSAPVAPPAPPPRSSAPVAPPAPPSGFSAPVAPPASSGSRPQVNSSEQTSSAEPPKANEPQITLDLSFMQMSIEPQSKSGSQSSNHLHR